MPKAASSNSQSFSCDGVRRVVGGDGVDRAVGEACDAGVDVVVGRAGAGYILALVS